MNLREENMDSENLSATKLASQDSRSEIDRRDFLKVLGGGLLVCLTPIPSLAQESGRGFGSHELPTDISAWIHIDADGQVKVFTGKVEVGQNIRTSLAQAVAEELRVPFDSITMVMGDTDLVPWDMGTFGSRTTPTMAPQLRNMAVAGRELLVEMAAKRWNTDGTKLVAASGKVTTPDGSKSLTYGELTRGEALVKSVAGDPPFTPATEWKIAGTPVPKANGRDFVTGKHQFPSDIVRPEMMFGAVLRPEGYNATLQSLDTSAAEKMPGVKVVRDGDFTGVVASDPFTAQQALAAIQAKWNVPTQQGNQGLFEYLKNNPEEEGERPDHVVGSVSEALCWRRRATRISIHGRVHCACSTGAARSGGRMEQWQTDRMDRHAAAFRSARRIDGGFQAAR